MINEFLNFEKACDFLGIKKATLYAKVAKRQIPHYKFGKFLFFKENELRTCIEAGRRKTEAELEAEAEKYLQGRGQTK